MTVLLEPPLTPFGATAARPGALGRIPRLPCEPTTWVLGCSLEASATTLGIVSVLDHSGGLLSGLAYDGNVVKSFRTGAGAMRGWYPCDAVVVGG